jgi:hypothetical protein
LREKREEDRYANIVVNVIMFLQHLIWVVTTLNVIIGNIIHEPIDDKLSTSFDTTEENRSSKQRKHSNVSPIEFLLSCQYYYYFVEKAISVLG